MSVLDAVSVIEGVSVIVEVLDGPDVPSVAVGAVPFTVTILVGVLVGCVPVREAVGVEVG